MWLLERLKCKKSSNRIEQFYQIKFLKYVDLNVLQILLP